MGWIPEDGYQRFVKKPENSNKVTEEQEKFNVEDIEDIITGIEIASQQYAKDHGIEFPKIRAKSKKKEPIEYVIEETKQAEIIPLNRKNIENIRERASGGEER